MFLKIMGGEDLPDCSNAKCFVLIEGKQIGFRREITRSGMKTPVPVAVVTFADGSAETYELSGNAYVLNGAGKTIDSFAHAGA